MGVLGLWRLVESAGKPVPFETLEDKIIVIDISIWLHQVVKGYTDRKGGSVHNAHLLGLFNRICKLLYFRIKPIFIFDGKVCNLKRETISKRSQQRSKLKTEAEKIEELLLQSLAKEKVIKEALGLDTKALTLSPIKKIKTSTRSEEKDDMFKLPPAEDFKSENLFSIKNENEEEDNEGYSNSKKSYNLNINKIDLNSSYFKSLAPDIRHEILVDLKETRKQNTWAKLKELPVESNDFSSYQMSGLLKRRQVQVKLEEAEKEMGGKVFSISELESLLAEDGVLEVGVKHAQVIAGDESTRFLLVRDIAKAISIAKEQETLQPGTSRDANIVKTENNDDYDLDLQKAIEMSLEDEEAIDLNEMKNEPVKLNAKQRKKFVGSFQNHSLVKGFMKEYGEMNEDDIQDLIESTQIETKINVQDESLTQKFPHTDRYVLYGSPEKSSTSNDKDEILENHIGESTINKKELFITSTEKSENSKFEKENMVITVDSANYSQEDDIFADIFSDNTDTEKISGVEKDKILDVEVASISDDDTIEYQISEQDFAEIETISKDETEIVENKEKVNIESSIYNDDDDEDNMIECENEKFWNSIEEIEDEYYKTQSKSIENTPEKNQDVKAVDEENFGEGIEKVLPNIEQEKMPDASVNNDIQDFENNQISCLQKEEESVENKLKTVSSDQEQLSPNKINNVLEKEEVPSTVQSLRNIMTDQELLKMEEELQKQQKNYVFEINKLDRQGTSITESMSRDCKELLKLFGIPYINAPTEAEAQCAFLNAVNLADGVITDDSDVLLFGAERVYKNFFLQKKVVKKFEMEDIRDKFKLDRKKLIQMAMLVGSDYTIGLNGVGTVTALEILAAFPTTPEEENSTDVYQSLLSSLRRFRDWFENRKNDASATKVLKSKLKNVEMISGFPNIDVMKAYLEPRVDTSLEEFTWGQPDLESIYEFTKLKLGWTRIKTQEILDPVMKRFKERKQKKMEDYFKVQLKKKAFDEQKLSKRVQTAIEKMSGNVDGNDKNSETKGNGNEVPKKTRKRKITNKVISKKDKKEIKEIQDIVLLLSDDDDEPPEKKTSPNKSTDDLLPETSTNEKKVNAFDLLKSPSKVEKKSIERKGRKRKTNNEETKPSTSKMTIDEEVLQPKRPVRIPETKQIIPQREKDKNEQELNKKRAIEIFKNSKGHKNK